MVSISFQDYLLPELHKTFISRFMMNEGASLFHAKIDDDDLALLFYYLIIYARFKAFQLCWQ